MPPRSLTLFGQALADLFLSLVLYFAVKSVFWGIFAWASWNTIVLERWQVIGLRAMVDAAAVYVIGTAFGVAWEMGRARVGPRMVVHIPADGPSDVDYDRRSGTDRRKGWGKLAETPDARTDDPTAPAV